jgi:hypothetical protein
MTSFAIAGMQLPVSAITTSIPTMAHRLATVLAIYDELVELADGGRLPKFDYQTLIVYLTIYTLELNPQEHIGHHLL